jgi:hypothetical protein
MTQETPEATGKYVDPGADYRKTQQRSTFAISKELFPNLEQAVKTSGANSVSDILRCIATFPDEAGELLKPIVERASVVHNPKPRKKYKKTEINELAAILKGSNLTAEEIAQLRAELAAKVGAA